MDKLKGCTPFPCRLVQAFGASPSQTTVLPSPPDSITTAQGTEANASTTDPFGISVMVVPRNANKSKSFLVDAMQTSMKNDPYLQQLTNSSV